MYIETLDNAYTRAMFCAIFHQHCQRQERVSFLVTRWMKEALGQLFHSQCQWLQYITAGCCHGGRVGRWYRSTRVHEVLLGVVPTRSSSGKMWFFNTNIPTLFFVRETKLSRSRKIFIIISMRVAEDKRAGADSVNAAQNPTTRLVRMINTGILDKSLNAMHNKS